MYLSIFEHFFRVGIVYSEKIPTFAPAIEKHIDGVARKQIENG